MTVIAERIHLQIRNTPDRIRDWVLFTATEGAQWQQLPALSV